MADKETKSPAADIAKSASENTLALNPIVGIRAQDMAAAGGTVLQALASQPQEMAKQWFGLANEFASILTKKSDVKPEPRDRRFADPAWQENDVNRTLMQAYLAWGDMVTSSVEKLDLPDRDAARARLVTSIFVDAMAPSNSLLTNPTAMKTLFETNGKSAADGAKNFINDMVKNGGLPSSVDTSKFKVGENLAVTPGNVVFKNDVIELVHYTANTPKVYQKPLFIVPPQINKYYSVDMSPGKSMIEFLLANGIQPYCISWWNPTAEMRDWDFQTYIEAMDEALDACLEITGADSVNIMGSCSGGITLSAYAGWLAAQGLPALADASSSSRVLAVPSVARITSFLGLFTAPLP